MKPRTRYSTRDVALYWAGWSLFVLGWALTIGRLAVDGVVELPFVVSMAWAGVTGGVSAVCFAVAIPLIMRSRRLRAIHADELLVTDRRPPILYLRSFRDDGVEPGTEGLYSTGWIHPTPEEQLAIAMNKVGPFIAIGRPGEQLPELGAARLYVEDDAWQQTVGELMGRAQLVVLRAGSTPGFWWELERVLATVDPRRMVFFFGPNPDRLYGGFRERAQSLFPCALPERIGKAAFLYLAQIGDRWTPKTVTPRISKRNFMGNSAIEQAFLEGLQPVFRQLGVSAPRPSFPLTYKFALACIGFVIVLAGVRGWVVGELQGAQRDLAQARLQAIGSALQQYYVEAGAYPSSQQGLTALLERGFLRPTELLDPWGRPFTYKPSDAPRVQQFEVSSLGADGLPGGSGNDADVRLSR